jgi:hypothetical protein
MPLGQGACGLVSVKEASEILGVQLKYTDKDNDTCHYGNGAGDVGFGLTVQLRPDAVHELSEKWKIDGFADKASWDFVDGIIFIQNGKGYRIASLDVGRTSVEVRAINLALGKKALARLAKK